MQKKSSAQINPEQINECHTRLEHLENDVTNILESGQDASETVVLDQSRVGRLSRMDAMQQQEMAKAELQHLKQRLKLVASALKKFNTNDYGYCEDCYEIIAYERLLIKPESQFCISCQSKRE